MTYYRQLGLFEEPEPGATVKDGAGRKVTHPDGRVTTKTGRTYVWLLCDRCGCGTWVGGRAPDQARLDDEEYRKKHGRPCRLTPRCPGRHLLSKLPPEVEALR